MIVVDTSVLIDFFRGASTPETAQLELMERDGIPFAIPAICCQEVLQGARDPSHWETLQSYLEGQETLLPRSPLDTHIDAARIYFDCRRAGLTPRSSTDCFIAQLVLDNDGVLLHSDRDFELIKEVRPIKTLHHTGRIHD